MTSLAQVQGRQGERGRKRRERVFLHVSPHSAAAEAFVTNDEIRERKKSVEGRKGAKAKVNLMVCMDDDGLSSASSLSEVQL